MDRKSALATAGAIAVTLTATGVAVAANMGILQQQPQSELGQLSSSTPQEIPATPAAAAEPQVVTIFEDVPVSTSTNPPAAGSGPATAPFEDNGGILPFDDDSDDDHDGILQFDDDSDDDHDGDDDRSGRSHDEDDDDSDDDQDSADDHEGFDGHDDDD